MIKRPRILLADDHRMVAEGLRGLLEPKFELIEIVENGQRLVETARCQQPDVIISDISMPILNGMDALKILKKENTDVKVILLTMHSDVTRAADALDAGACGYVLKHSAPSELNIAIQHVLQGRTYITPKVKKQLASLPLNPSGERKNSSSHLTIRQREVLQLLAEGDVVKEISCKLNISPKTVEYHKYKMMKDIGKKTVADLIRYAVKHKIVSE